MVGGYSNSNIGSWIWCNWSLEFSVIVLVLEFATSGKLGLNTFTLALPYPKLNRALIQSSKWDSSLFYPIYRLPSLFTKHSSGHVYVVI